jgi:hypothetical protein
MFLVIVSIVMQCLGLASILFAIECFKPPIKRTKKNKITGNTTGDILAGIFNLFLGVILFGMFGIFFVFGDFPSGKSLPIWTLLISIGLIFYLYFQLPKTKIWKNRGKAKQPIEDGTNLMFRLIGQGIMLVGAGHILFPIYVWLKSGVWITISLGDWGLTVLKLNELGRFDTGWWAINKVLNYIILDQSAALPLVVLGYIIYVSASDD